ncbi:MAG: hypothetical protein JF627_04705 [Alphaproteobacteria bacterium]|nr:hypothetical protein [Alphaproteobacteria bacterium]
MKLIYPAILAGAALAGLAIFVPSWAGKEAVHHITVALPDGRTETISYTGSTIPKVTLNPAPLEIAWPGPAAFGLMPALGGGDGLFADMDRSFGALLHHAEIMQQLAANPGLHDALPFSTGETTYTLIAESLGRGACTRMVQVTQQPGQNKPQVLTRTSGNCDADGAKPAAPAPDSATIKAHMTTATPTARMAL